MGPEFPTVDLRNALNTGLVPGPRLIVAAHIISSSAGHGDMRAFHAPRWNLPPSTIADSGEESGEACAASTRTARTGSRPPTRRLLQRRRRPPPARPRSARSSAD
jgi:hypothetical protein